MKLLERAKAYLANREPAEHIVSNSKLNGLSCGIFLDVDCDKYRCRISGADGFEITINDDLTPMVKDGVCQVDVQYHDAIGDKPRGTRITMYLS